LADSFAKNRAMIASGSGESLQKVRQTVTVSATVGRWVVGIIPAFAQFDQQFRGDLAGMKNPAALRGVKPSPRP
jgi:hypothetical protein